MATNRPLLLMLVMLGALASGDARAATDDAADVWQFSLTPYLLLPGVDATLGVDGSAGDPAIDAGPADILSMINFVVMLQTEARRGRAFTFVDWMYIDLGQVSSVVRAIDFPGGSVPVGATLTLDSDASFDGFMVMAAGGYRVIEDARGDLDLYGGLRTLNLSTSLRWTLSAAIPAPTGSITFPISGETSSGDETWDWVAGARGSLQFGGPWRGFGVADHGWGHGTESWQWALGVSRESQTVRLELAWRELGWQGLGEGNTGRLRLYGPMFGATFRF